MIDPSLTLRDITEVGYATLPGALPAPLLEALRQEADQLIEAFTVHGERSSDFWSYDDPKRGNPVLYRIHNLERQSAQRIASLYETGILHELAQAIIGPSRPTAYAMVTKVPGAAGVPWHRDRATVENSAIINLSIYLDKSTEENGCLEVVPGSHRLPGYVDVEATRAQGPVVAVPAEPGDIVVHDVRLVHGSGDNENGPVRRSIIAEFAADPLLRPSEGASR